MKSSASELYRYTNPAPVDRITNRPSGLDAILRTTGLPPGTTRLLVPNTPEFNARGTASFPTTLHSVPSDMMICGPRWLDAITLGVINENPALNGSGGNFTRPTVLP